MLYYPKMPSSEKVPLGTPCIAFEKLDGTNLHFCWDRAFGWHAFGTRRDRFELTPAGILAFSESHPELSIAPDLFEQTLAHGVAAVLTTYAASEATVFAEFLGEHSFAGQHRTDDEKRLVLFDVAVEDEAFISPETFVHDFAHLPTPQVIYRGKRTGQFTEDVRRGRFDVSEGVVCKGVYHGAVWRCKIKTDAYAQRLKAYHGERWSDFWE